MVHTPSLLLPGLATIKLVSSTGEQASGILVAAAAPVTLLTALSKSSLGKQVQDSLNQKLPQLQAEAEALRQQHAGVCVCRRALGSRGLPVCLSFGRLKTRSAEHMAGVCIVRQGVQLQQHCCYAGQVTDVTQGVPKSHLQEIVS